MHDHSPIFEKIFASHAEFLISHSRRLLASYSFWLGSPLVPNCDREEELARALFHAPFVVLSSGMEDDPVLNYANLAGMKLWNLPWEKITRMPARLTAEADERNRRAEFLRQVRENGHVRNYSGIRISSTGERFEIRNAVVWNVRGPQGEFFGQAATFASWSKVPCSQTPEKNAPSPGQSLV